MRRIGISPCRTLCSGFHHEAYRYQSMSHSMQWFSPWGVSVSVHVALYAVVFTIRRIGISPCRTLYSGFHYEAYRYQSMSHSIQWFSLWGVSVSAHVALYAVVFTMRRIGISPCRTLAIVWAAMYTSNYVMCDIIMCENTYVVHAIWENTAQCCISPYRAVKTSVYIQYRNNSYNVILSLWFFACGKLIPWIASLVSNNHLYLI